MKRVSLIVATLLVIVIASLSVFMVPEGLQAARTQRWQPVDRSQLSWEGPGLHFHWPIIERLVWLDLRKQLLAANGSSKQPYAAVTTFDQKNLELGYVVMWQIADVKTFSQNFTSPDAATQTIRTAVNQVLTKCCLSQTLAQWLNKANLATTSQNALTELNKQLANNGVELSLLDITTITVPASDRDAWLSNIKSTQQAELTKLRLQTASMATDLKNQVDMKVATLLADGKKQADQIQAEADARANLIYADAYNRSPSFYEFYYNLKAYQRVFQERHPVFVTDTNTPFFKALEEAGGKS
jgi:modulator of FtsH protease HflC